MNVETVARRYAEAYLQAMQDAGAVQEARADMLLLDQVCKERADLLARLAAPGTGPQARREVLMHAFGGRVHACTLNLLTLCADRGRTRMIGRLPAACVEVSERHEGVVRATVTSARVLGEPVRQRFQEWLRAHTGKAVRVAFREDGRLGAGFRVVYNSTMVDASAAGGLARMRREMMTGLEGRDGSGPATGVQP